MGGDRKGVERGRIWGANGKGRPKLTYVCVTSRDHARAGRGLQRMSAGKFGVGGKKQIKDDVSRRWIGGRHEITGEGAGTCQGENSLHRKQYLVADAIVSIERMLL